MLDSLEGLAACANFPEGHGELLRLFLLSLQGLHTSPMAVWWFE